MFDPLGFSFVSAVFSLLYPYIPPVTPSVSPALSVHRQTWKAVVASEKLGGPNGTLPATQIAVARAHCGSVVVFAAHLRDVVLLTWAKQCTPLRRTLSGVGGCAPCVSACLVSPHPTREAFRPHYFHRNHRSAFSSSSSSSLSSPLQPRRVKAELRGSDVSPVLTSPHRLTDVERVIRGKSSHKRRKACLLMRAPWDAA